MMEESIYFTKKISFEYKIKYIIISISYVSLAFLDRDKIALFR